MEPSHVCRQHKLTVTGSPISGDFKQGDLNFAEIRSGIVDLSGSFERRPKVLPDPGSRAGPDGLLADERTGAQLGALFEGRDDAKWLMQLRA
jgi:hypothetical protein